MAYPNKWSTFSCTITDVEKHCPNVLSYTSSNVLSNLIDNAIERVKNDLRGILTTKFKQDGKSRSDYPNEGQDPDDIFDALFDDTFPIIREKVVYWTLYLAVTDDVEKADGWKEKYDDVNLDVVSIWTDVDADNVLDNDEDINIQDLLNNRRP